MEETTEVCAGTIITTTAQVKCEQGTSAYWTVMNVS